MSTTFWCAFAVFYLGIGFVVSGVMFHTHAVHFQGHDPELAWQWRRGAYLFYALTMLLMPIAIIKLWVELSYDLRFYSRRREILKQGIAFAFFFGKPRQSACPPRSLG